MPDTHLIVATFRFSANAIVNIYRILAEANDQFGEPVTAIGVTYGDRHNRDGRVSKSIAIGLWTERSLPNHIRERLQIVNGLRVFFWAAPADRALFKDRIIDYGEGTWFFLRDALPHERFSDDATEFVSPSLVSFSMAAFFEIAAYWETLLQPARDMGVVVLRWREDRRFVTAGENWFDAGPGPWPDLIDRRSVPVEHMCREGQIDLAFSFPPAVVDTAARKYIDIVNDPVPHFVLL